MGKLMSFRGTERGKTAAKNEKLTAQVKEQLLPYLPLSSYGDVNQTVVVFPLFVPFLFLSKGDKGLQENRPCLKLFSQGTPTMKILQKCLISSLVSKKPPQRSYFPTSFSAVVLPPSFPPSLPCRGGDRE